MKGTTADTGTSLLALEGDAGSPCSELGPPARRRQGRWGGRTGVGGEPCTRHCSVSPLHPPLILPTCKMGRRQDLTFQRVVGVKGKERPSVSFLSCFSSLFRTVWLSCNLYSTRSPVYTAQFRVLVHLQSGTTIPIIYLRTFHHPKETCAH